MNEKLFIQQFTGQDGSFLAYFSSCIIAHGIRRCLRHTGRIEHLLLDVSNKAEGNAASSTHYMQI